MTAEEAARGYYRAIDDADYDALAALLDPGFTHHRPDRTLAGRERFVAFMRDERPRTDTVHEVDAVYGPASDEVAVRGRLCATDGEELFGFVDVFRFGEDGIVELVTYTR